MTVRFNFNKTDVKTIPMGMAENSIDDMYFGCNEKMGHIVNQTYIEKEKQHFSKEWRECAKYKYKILTNLTSLQMEAICLYTGDNVYLKFNKEVRDRRSNYDSNSLEFHFHTLHYLLVSAIQILNRNYDCHTVYRRTTLKFAGEVNQVVRFGSFASSSYRKNLRDFGHESCFEIKTCTGAPLEKLSKFADEAEVLIPPYEMFKITKIITQSQIEIKGLKDCKIVFFLESAGVQSNLNCKLVHQ
ncbi:NAD(P)(+)--arginine ADP-ribosyltransferase 2-like [Antennarius striatus]|uniref:NAD(P)(+)--arginine ADP-ribosyltransferase 2-like n=1 Tax=Antennarius striatus TaxID=241820 RepID=UPI0035B25E01